MNVPTKVSFNLAAATDFSEKFIFRHKSGLKKSKMEPYSIINSKLKYYSGKQMSLKNIQKLFYVHKK